MTERSLIKHILCLHKGTALAKEYQSQGWTKIRGQQKVTKSRRQTNKAKEAARKTNNNDAGTGRTSDSAAAASSSSFERAGVTARAGAGSSQRAPKGTVASKARARAKAEAEAGISREQAQPRNGNVSSGDAANADDAAGTHPKKQPRREVVLNPLLFAPSPTSKASAGRGGCFEDHESDDESSDDDDDDVSSDEGGDDDRVQSDEEDSDDDDVEHADEDKDVHIDSSDAGTSDEQSEDEEGEDAGEEERNSARKDGAIGAGVSNDELKNGEEIATANGEAQPQNGRANTPPPYDETRAAADEAAYEDDGLGQSDDEVDDELHVKGKQPSSTATFPLRDTSSDSHGTAATVKTEKGNQDDDAWEVVDWRTIPKEESVDDDCVSDDDANVGAPASVDEEEERADVDAPTAVKSEDGDDGVEGEEEEEEEDEEEVLGTDEDEPEDAMEVDRDMAAEEPRRVGNDKKEKPKDIREEEEAVDEEEEEEEEVIIGPPSPPEPPTEPHTFVKQSMPLPFPTSLSESFTALVLRKTQENIRNRRGRTRDNSRGRGDVRPALKFTDAAEYAAYHRTLILEECASSASSTLATPKRDPRFVTRWVVVKGHDGDATRSRAEAGGIVSLVSGGLDREPLAVN